MSRGPISYPPDAVKVQPGVYLLETTTSGKTRLFQVRDVVELRRLVPFFDDRFIEEADTLDSEPPSYLIQIYCVLTAFDGEFGSLAEATHAIDARQLQSDDTARLLELAQITPDHFTLYPAG